MPRTQWLPRPSVPCAASSDPATGERNSAILGLDVWQYVVSRAFVLIASTAVSLITSLLLPFRGFPCPIAMIRAITAKPCGRAVVSPFAKKLSKNGPVSRAVRVRAEDEEAKPSSGHSTGEQPEISEEMKKEIEAYKENEKNAARLTPAEELRTLVASAKFGTLSTLASTGAIKGYPLGSVLPYAIDDDGNIICALSNLSSHKKYAPPPARVSHWVNDAVLQLAVIMSEGIVSSCNLEVLEVLNFSLHRFARGWPNACALLPVRDTDLHLAPC